MSSAKFLLEHFYFGQIVQDGMPVGDAQLLAASPGVTPALAETAVERVRVPPYSRIPEGTWALVRGRDRHVPFVLVQSQLGSSGEGLAHYILPQPDVLRAVGGHLKALASLVEVTLPTFAAAGGALPPLELEHPAPRSVEDQVEDLLTLMTLTHNRIPILEMLLAAIVQGVQLVVQGAPDDFQERLAFVEGILALLPPSARFGVTFTTHSLPATEIDTQVRFYSDDPPPLGTLVYHWPEARLSGEDLSDDYSRFVISQLRLDAELVIQRTTALTHIAGWRLNQGDKLAEALGYAGMRLKVDEALRQNQPVAKDEVGRILAADPTLTAELRLLYADHLMKFSLAMRDMSHAEPVAMLLRANPEMQAPVLRQLNEALNGGEGRLVMETLLQWMANPLGPEGAEWVGLTHRALLAGVAERVQKRDVDGVNAVLLDLHDTGPAVAVGAILPQLGTLVVPLDDTSISENLFLLAVKTLDADAFRDLMNHKSFRDQLPLNVRRAYSWAIREESGTPPEGLLIQMARSFGERWEGLILMRFAELADQNANLEIIDTAALRGLAQLATSAEGVSYARPLLRIVDHFTDEHLLNLAAPGPFFLLQIRLALRDYTQLARSMIHQSALLYAGDRQGEYLKVVGQLFTDTPLDSTSVVLALEGIQQGGVRSVPYVVAAISGLRGRGAAQELDEVAASTAQRLLAEPGLLENVPPSAILALLHYHVDQKETVGIIRAAALVPMSAAHQGKNGIRMMSQMYKMLDVDERTRTASLHLLRTYVREAPHTEARQAVIHFGRELGQAVGTALETTYAVRGIMGDTPLLVYADRIHHAAGLLQDTAVAYVNPRDVPTTGAINNALEEITPKIPLADRHAVSAAMLTIAKAIVVLGKQHRANRPRDENKFVNRLLTGEADPHTSLDVLKAMGGYFARGRRFDVALTSTTTPRLFGGRKSSEFRDAVLATAAVLEDLLRTLPAQAAPALATHQIRAEIESQWSEVDTEQQRIVVRDLATDLQRLVDVIAYLETNGEAAVADDNSGISRQLNSGRRRPKSALELYRYLAAYFRARG